jgi:hypothetical protein
MLLSICQEIWKIWCDSNSQKRRWKQYFERVYEHSQQKKQPRKWIYDIDSVFLNCGPRLQNVSCTEHEAEIYIAFIMPTAYISMV